MNYNQAVSHNKSPTDRLAASTSWWVLVHAACSSSSKPVIIHTTWSWNQHQITNTTQLCAAVICTNTHRFNRHFSIYLG